MRLGCPPSAALPAALPALATFPATLSATLRGALEGALHVVAPDRKDLAGGGAEPDIVRPAARSAAYIPHGYGFAPITGFVNCRRGGEGQGVGTGEAGAQPLGSVACLRFGQARLCPPTVDQIAALAALDTPQSYFDGVHAEYERRRDVLVDELRQVPGVVCTKPAGAFYLMAELPVDSSESFCRWMLEDFEHQGRTVMMAPGPGFYITEGAGAREVRLAYVLCTEDLVNAVAVLRQGLAQYPGRL